MNDCNRRALVFSRARQMILTNARVAHNGLRLRRIAHARSKTSGVNPAGIPVRRGLRAGQTRRWPYCIENPAALGVRDPGGIDRISQRKGTLALGSRLFLARLADVDSALEERSIFDRDPLRDHVAGQGAVCADVYPVRGVDVALHLAEHHHFPGLDVSVDLPIAPDGHPVAVKCDRALDLAIDVKRFGAAQLALDDQALADRRLFTRGSGRAARCDTCPARGRGGLEDWSRWRRGAGWFIARSWRRPCGLIRFPHKVLWSFPAHGW